MIISLLISFTIQSESNLLGIFILLPFLYLSWSSATTLSVGADNKRIPAPDHMRRSDSKFPIIISSKITDSRSGKKKIKLDVKNILGNCPICEKHGVNNSIVYLKPESLLKPFDLIGVCEVSNEHKFNFDSIEMEGARLK